MNDILQRVVDGEYEINQNIAVFRDGGTLAFQIRDNKGRVSLLYLDRRLKTETKDVFYKDAYPGKEGSTQLGINEALVIKVEAALDKPK